jgi:hypothetical protein
LDFLGGAFRERDDGVLSGGGCHVREGKLTTARRGVKRPEARTTAKKKAPGKHPGLVEENQMVLRRGCGGG